MAKRATTSTNRATAQSGEQQAKSLLEKQVAALNGAEKKLVDTLAGFDKASVSMNELLTAKYYEIQEKTKELKELEATELESRTAKIKELEDKLAQLDKDHTVAVNDFQVTFDLAIKASKEVTLQGLLNEFDLAYLSSEEKLEMEAELTNAAEVLKGEVAKAKKMTEHRVARDKDAEITTLKLTHEKEQSSNVAEITQLQNQIVFLENQLVKSDQRTQDILNNHARVAEAGSGITINTNEKNR